MGTTHCLHPLSTVADPKRARRLATVHTLVSENVVLRDADLKARRDLHRHELLQQQLEGKGKLDRPAVCTVVAHGAYALPLRTLVPRASVCAMYPHLAHTTHSKGSDCSKSLSRNTDDAPWLMTQSRSIRQNATLRREIVLPPAVVSVSAPVHAIARAPCP